MNQGDLAEDIAVGQSPYCAAVVGDGDSSVANDVNPIAAASLAEDDDAGGGRFRSLLVDVNAGLSARSDCVLLR